MKLVKGRKRRVNKRNYAEKVEDDMSPYHSYHQVSAIERYYWLLACSLTKVMCQTITFCSLRNRFNFLMNFTCILRNESITLAELSDCRMVEVKQEQSPDKMDIFLLTIATGKTIQSDSPSQYGRATRHKDVAKCSISALGFYLLYRFHVTGEFVGELMPDMRINESWFDWKLLIEGKAGTNNTTQMQQRTYQDSVRDVFDKLGIHAPHKGHWGRVTGPAYLEFNELPPDMIKLLGKLAAFV